MNVDSKIKDVKAAIHILQFHNGITVPFYEDNVNNFDASSSIEVLKDVLLGLERQQKPAPEYTWVNFGNAVSYIGKDGEKVSPYPDCDCCDCDCCDCGKVPEYTTVVETDEERDARIASYFKQGWTIVESHNLPKGAGMHAWLKLMERPRKDKNDNL